MNFLTKWIRYQKEKTVIGNYFEARDLKELFETNLTYKQAEIINHITRKEQLLMIAGMLLYLVLGVAIGYLITASYYIKI